MTPVWAICVDGEVREFLGDGASLGDVVAFGLLPHVRPLPGLSRRRRWENQARKSLGPSPRSWERWHAGHKYAVHRVSAVVRDGCYLLAERLPDALVRAGRGKFPVDVQQGAKVFRMAVYGILSEAKNDDEARLLRAATEVLSVRASASPWLGIVSVSFVLEVPR